MMSRNSFTSSSDLPRHFLLRLAGITITLVLIAVLVTIYGYRQGVMGFAFVRLYNYQLDKIANETPVHTVFVGDSSLGNAIDVKTWQTLDDRPAINLALTGAYGYAGTLNMMRRAQSALRPARYIIMQTPAMLARPVAWDGWIHTAPNLSDYSRVPVTELMRTFINGQAFVAALRGLFAGPPEGHEFIENDYIRQGPKRSIQPGQKFGSGTIKENPSKLAFLQQINQFCLDQNVECMYLHGPLIDLKCTNSPLFFKQIAKMVRQSGLNMPAEKPFCMTSSQLGDSFDHVAPEYKSISTRYYYNLLVSK